MYADSCFSQLPQRFAAVLELIVDGIIGVQLVGAPYYATEGSNWSSYSLIELSRLTIVFPNPSEVSPSIATI